MFLAVHASPDSVWVAGVADTLLRRTPKGTWEHLAVPTLRARLSGLASWKGQLVLVGDGEIVWPTPRAGD